MVQDTLQATREAHAKGKDFSARSVVRQRRQPLRSRGSRRRLRGRLILLTDNPCFSSCLAVTDDFRTLGAYHIRQTTDAATHFVDVREQ